MAKFATHDSNFAAASAEASSTYPVQCGALKKGGLVVLKVTLITAPCVHVSLCKYIYNVFVHAMGWY